MRHATGSSTVGIVVALVLAGCSDSREPLLTAPAALVSLQQAKPTTVPVDVVKGKGADVSDDALDAALKEINKVFEKAGITFTRNTVSSIADTTVAQTPLDGGPNAALTDEQKKVMEAGEKTAKAQPKNGKLTVIIVEDFRSANPNLQTAAAKTVVGKGPVLIPDPFHTERRSLGAVPFWVVLAHELGHALGLTHKVLDSDKNYANQKNGQYSWPNLMGNPEGAEGIELTPDQIQELQKGVQRFKNGNK